MSPRRSVAVTGAGGFIGSALVEELRPRVPVHGLVRTLPERVPSELRLVRGDLSDRKALEALFDDADIVVHAAATMAKGDRMRSWQVNVNGTESAIRAAAAAGVRRFVYVSSISVLGATPARSGVLTEDDEPRNEGELNAYARSKLEGERVTRRLAERLGVEHVVVRPTNVYGPGSRPWFSMYERLVERVPLAFGRVPIDMVYISDVVDGLVAACREADAEGEVFHVGHEMIELATFIEGVGIVVGRRCRRLPALPDALLRSIIDRGYRVATGRRLSLSLRCAVAYPHDKAASILGYAPAVTLTEGLDRLGAWRAGATS